MNSMFDKDFNQCNSNTTTLWSTHGSSSSAIALLDIFDSLKKRGKCMLILLPAVVVVPLQQTVKSSLNFANYFLIIIIKW